MTTKHVIIQAENELRNYLKKIYPDLHEQIKDIIFKWKPHANHREKARV